MKHKYPKYVFTALEAQSNVSRIFQPSSCDDVPRSRVQTPLCAVVSIEITTLKKTSRSCKRKKWRLFATAQNSKAYYFSTFSEIGLYSAMDVCDYGLNNNC